MKPSITLLFFITLIMYKHVNFYKLKAFKAFRYKVLTTLVSRIPMPLVI